MSENCPDTVKRQKFISGRNHEKSRHHHRHHSSTATTLDGSPMKKARLSGSENGNGAEKRPPLPPQPPLPRPPPPP